MKKISVREFRELGLLQEVNRRMLNNPLYFRLLFFFFNDLKSDHPWLEYIGDADTAVG